MILEAIHVEKFGKWTGLRLNHLEEGVNLFYGSNETGKTTLMQFLRSMFYGFSADRLAYASESEPEKTGGDVLIRTEKGTWNLSRHLISSESGTLSSPAFSAFGKNTTSASELHGVESGRNAEMIPGNSASDSASDSDSASVSAFTSVSASAFSREKSAARMEIPENRLELPFYARESFRRRYETGKFEDGLLLTDAAGTRQDAFPLKDLLSLSRKTGTQSASLALDETLFNNIFAVGLQELQKLSVLNSTEASRQLYDLSTGLERFSLQNILAYLQENRQKFLGAEDVIQTFRPDEFQWTDDFLNFFFRNEAGKSSGASNIVALCYYREVLKKRLENVQSQQKQYIKIHAERTNSVARLDALKDEIEQQRHKIRIYEIAEKISGVWKKREETDAEIVEFSQKNPELADISESALEMCIKNLKSLKSLRASAAELQEKRESMLQEYRKTRDLRRAIPLDRALLQKLPQIEILLQQQDWMETLRGRLEDLIRVQMDSEAQLSIDYRRLGLELPDFSSELTPEEFFPYDSRTLRPLRTPTREMFRIRTKIQQVQKSRSELLNEAGDCARKVSTYFRESSGRVKNGNEIQELPELTGFPEIFRLTDSESDARTDAAAARNPISGNSRTESVSKALSAVNSRILNEIPAEILDARHVNRKSLENEEQKADAYPVSGRDLHPDSQNDLRTDSYGASRGDSVSASDASELMDVNAASRLLGEVLASQRRMEINVQQLAQAVRTLGEIRKELKKERLRQILSGRDMILMGTSFISGLTVSMFEAVRLAGWLPPASYFTSFFFFVLGSGTWVGCGAGRFLFLKKLEQKIQELSENLENAERQRNRLIRLCFPVRETEILELSDDEILDLCVKEERKIQKRVEFLTKELHESETVGTFASKRTALLLEARQLNARLHRLEHAYADAKARRREVLKSLALPENWNTAKIRDLRDAADRVRELWRRRGRDLEDFTLYSQELALFVQRLQKLLEDFGNDFAHAQSGGDERFPFLASVFTNIRTKIEDEQKRDAEALKLEQKIRFLQKNGKKLDADLRKLSEERLRLLDASGVSDGKSLAEKIHKLRELQDLRMQRRECQKNIDVEIAFTCSESMFWDLYEKNSPDKLTELRKVAQNVLSENEFQRESLQKRLNECDEILKNIVTDDTPSRLVYELRETEARLGHSINLWRTHALAQRLAETIQRTYQLKRQPLTLERASVYVREMTEEKYVRVWTPVDEDILYVERRDGTAFSAEQLSTGTRELLYLAIRLALIEEYRTKGVTLPVILDDVLVNFDRRRASAAAKVLTDFAGKNTQILFFTSHEHIREIFEKENALICDMENVRNKTGKKA